MNFCFYYLRKLVKKESVTKHKNERCNVLYQFKQYIQKTHNEKRVFV